jgi:hypothetical protein
MPLILNNHELESAIDMPSCIEALYEALKAYNRKDAARRPRIDIFAPTSRTDEFACFSSMEGRFAAVTTPSASSPISFRGPR